MRRHGSLWVLTLCGTLVAPALAQQPGDADGRFTAAVALANGKKWAEAAPVLERWLSEFPMHPRAAAARLRLGEAYLGLNQPELAVRTFEALVGPAISPDVRAEALLGLGRARLAQKDPARALAPLQESFGLVEKSALLGPTAASLLGDTLMTEGRYREAAGVFDHFTQWPTHADAPRAAFMTAEAYRLAGDAAEAVAAYRVMRAQFGESPLVPRALLGAADALLRLSRYDEAEVELRRLLQQYPDSLEAPRAQLALGRSAFLRGSFSVARSAYQAAALLFPNGGVPAEAELRIADCYRAERNLAEARTRYSKLATAPEKELAGEALYSLAELEADAGQPGRAADLLRALGALAGAGRWPAAGSVRLAELQLRSGEAKTAVSLAREVLVRKPEPELRDGAAVVLAEGLLQQGDAAGAETELAPVLARKKPGRLLDRAEAAAARCRLERGESDAAVEQCTALLRRELAGETRAEVLATLGGAQLAMKKDGAAVTTLRQALDRFPATSGGARAGKLLAAHYRKSGREADARQVEAALGKMHAPGLVLAADMLRKADSASRAGSHAEAIRLFGQALEDGADHEHRLQARAGIIDAAAHLRRPAEVTAQLVEIVKEQPPAGFVVRAALGASKVLAAGGDREGAAEVLRTARSAGTDRESGAELNLALGRLLVDGGRLSDAEPAYREALAGGAKPIQVEALYALAWLKGDTGRAEEALALFRQLADSYPEHPFAADAHFRVGEAEFEAGRFDAAAEQYQAALRGKHAAADRIAYRLGWALRRREQHAEAAAAFARAGSSQDPALAFESRLRAGEEYLEAGRAEDAARQVEPLLAQEQLSGDLRLQARATAAQAYNHLHQYARTLELTSGGAAADDWYTARLLLARAEALRKQSGPRGAAALYARVAQRFSQDAEIAAEAGFQGGECEQAAGNAAAARAAWERTAQRYPESRWSELSRKRLHDRPEGRKTAPTRTRR